MKQKRFLIFTGLLCLSILSGCDWLQSSFLNGIPICGSQNKEIKVYLAIDGLSYSSVEKARAQGAFAGNSWRHSKFITTFPGTSDASWTRILHTEPLVGYEYTYFDPSQDKIINPGMSGLVKHVVPTFVDGMSMEAPYLKAFDYRSNGYTHSIGVYHDTFANLGESYDNLFFTLDGRSQTNSTFSAYLIEIDAMGHIFKPEDVVESLRILDKKINVFKAKHPDKKFVFTILADHGIDFVNVESKNLMKLSEEIKKVGVTPVENIRGQTAPHYAVPIDHVRLTYLSLHTSAEQVKPVATKVSELPFIDVTVAKIRFPNEAQKTLTTDWYGIYESGKEIVDFGYDAQKNTYLIPTAMNWERFGISKKEPAGKSPTYSEFSDEDLFAFSKHSAYPDLFYRIRTGLSAVGVQYPADVLLSLKPGFAAIGFTLPGGSKDFSLAGFHGSLRDLGTVATLLTEERDLPDAVRSEDIYKLFPDFQKNVSEKTKLY